MRRLLLILLFLAVSMPCMAQSAGGPFAAKPQDSNSATAVQAAEPGLLSRAIATVIGEQRKFHRSLAAALEDIRNSGSAAAAWTLIVTSFLYGIFHAAGPGHGKAILTTYLATHRQRMLRGILLSAAAAGVQGLVAIVLVFGLTTVAGWAARDTQSAVRWAEQSSFALVAALGGYLLFRAARALWRSLVRPAYAAQVLAHAHMPGPEGHDHAHDHAHDHCGHAHMPTPDQMDAARDFRTMTGVVLSIGIRPCSGAVLVLAVANVFGIPWAGIAGVAAMSLGTAIAVATLAFVVLAARRFVSTLAAADSPGVAIAGQAVAMLGGAIILILGLTLLAGSFGPAHPLGL